MKKAKILQKKDFGKICRCCLGTGPTASIFELQFEKTLFIEILQCLFCSEIKLNDELPKNLCESCIGEVVRYYGFKRSYDMAEAVLLGVLENSEEEEENEKDETCEIKLEILSEEDCLEINGDIEIQFYDNSVEGTSKENEDANHSNSIEDCEDKENNERLSLKTEIKLEDTTDENLSNPVIWDDLAQEYQIMDIPNPETNDGNLNDPIALDDLPQQRQIVGTPNPETNENLNALPRQSQIVDIAISETGDQDKVPRNRVCINNTKDKDGVPLKMITCSCLKVFSTQSSYFLHRKKEKNLHRVQYRCDICNKCFLRPSFLIHMRSHTNERPYNCEMCTKSFTCYSNLHRHKKIHFGEKPHVCEHCGTAFAQRVSLVYHRRTHTKEKPYPCARCGKRFTNPILLYIHNKKHKEEAKDLTNFLCSICDKQFCTEASLLRHNFVQHNHYKTYLCTYCGKRFSCKAVFQQHTYIHTGETPFSCKFCDKQFRHSTTLKMHTYTHTGEKPNVCKICKRGFTQRQHLKQHLRTHSGEKPYKCNLCEKAFADKTNLTVHIRIHTGERPYVCDGCQKRFYHPSALKKHRRRHCKGAPANDA